jgi:ubiquinol-cytochrome c reductase cytochrome b subunit
LDRRLKELWEALDERTGAKALLSRALDEKVPGGARFAYTPGSALTIVFGVQLLTGIGLAVYYSASSTDAWASVFYIERKVAFGSLVRGLHHWGATAMLVVLGLHLGQTFLFGAYKRPRELVWWSGLVLLALTLAFGLTGYLLPWDQKGYWATRVATNIAGTLPLVGTPLQHVAQGGNEYGNLTLTRFYALHVVVLPLLVLAVLGAHLVFFRAHGNTASWKHRDGAPAGRFWPDQLLRNALVGTLIVGAMLVLAARAPAPIEAPADPAGDYLARPEWYFLPLFQLLKYFEGALQPLGTMVIPGLMAGFLVLLPLLDRGAERNPLSRQRVPYVSAMALLFLFLSGLTFLAKKEDAEDVKFNKMRGDSERAAKRALVLAEKGVPPEGALALVLNDPQYKGARVFKGSCAACHAIGGEGGKKAPELTGFLSLAWIRGVIANAEAPGYFGPTKIRGMDPYEKLGEEKLSALAGFLHALRGHDGPPSELPDSLRGGQKLFEAEGCDTCHSLAPGEESVAPNLSGYGSARWLRDFVGNPASGLAYGKDNEMPLFEKRLEAHEIDAAVVYLQSLEGAGLRD